MPLVQKFQPCQLKKGTSHNCRRYEPLGGLGACSPRKILRYVPLRYHFLHFEITVKWKYQGHNYHRFMFGCQNDKNGWEPTELTDALDWRWSSLRSQIDLVYLLDKHPLPYLDLTTLFQKFFEVFPFTHTHTHKIIKMSPIW